MKSFSTVLALVVTAAPAFAALATTTVRFDLSFHINDLALKSRFDILRGMMMARKVCLKTSRNL